MKHPWRIGCLTIILISNLCSCSPGGNHANSSREGEHTPGHVVRPDGSLEKPLRVMFIPAEGGFDVGDLDDYGPTFDAITQAFGIHFILKMGETYHAVVEAMENDQADLAYLGPFTYYEARQKGAAEFLAIGVCKGKSVYFSGIFALRSSNFRDLSDIKGHSVAFGDIDSTSSFQLPVALLLSANIDPANDLSAIYLTGSHAASLGKLLSGTVDAACASFTAYQRGVEENLINPYEVRPFAVSEEIPFPPLTMSPELSPTIKSRLKNAFKHIHDQPGISPDDIRGFDGIHIDRFQTEFPDSEFDRIMKRLTKVTDKVINSMLEKSVKEQDIPS